jgi:hypothetical protein
MDEHPCACCNVNRRSDGLWPVVRWSVRMKSTMARPAWLTLGLVACISCGGKVVSMEGVDGSMQTQLPPSQRGSADASVTPPPEDSGTTPPPPVDAGVDVPRPPVDAGVDVPRPPVDTGMPPVDAGMPIDRAPDLIVVVDAAPDTPVIRCGVNNTMACPDGMYCLTPNCGNNGTCVAVPTSAQQAPVCGCDRLTYWNATVAADNGTSVRADGACAAGAVNSIACGGVQNVNCPAGSFCNLEQAADTTCNANAAGHCWMLPATCPALPAGTTPTTRRCVGGGVNPPCMPACDLIRTERVFITDATCP